MIFDITPILMSMVANNANRANEDLSDEMKADGKDEDDNGGEYVVVLFKVLIRTLRIALIIALLFALFAILTRFLL